MRFGGKTLYFAALLAAAAPAAVSPLLEPPPGLLNFMTGDVRINGVAVAPIRAGQITLGTGETLETGNGMAELLLTPGSFLRVGARSKVMLETRAPEILFRLTKGEALVEVLDPKGRIALEQKGLKGVLQKQGLYDFDETRGVAAVYSGEAQFRNDGREILVTQGFGVRRRGFREVRIDPSRRSALFLWSGVRSQELSAESAAWVRMYPGKPAGLQGARWWWDPWAASYTYLSASGAIAGPFGWPYYSPGYVPNYAPLHPNGDLYGPPVLNVPPPPAPPVSGEPGGTPRVPLTAPGEPQFPNNRF